MVDLLEEIETQEVDKDVLLQWILPFHEDNKKIILKIINYQKIDLDIATAVLRTNNYEVMNELMGMIEGEIELPQDLISSFFIDFQFEETRSVLINRIYLQPEILEQICQQYFDTYVIDDLIREQRLPITVIDQLLSEDFLTQLTKRYIKENRRITHLHSDTLEFEHIENRVIELLIWNHPLPDKWLQFFFQHQLHVDEIIEAQKLSQEWLLYFLKEERWRDKYYHLLRNQEFGEDAIEFIFNMDYDVILYSVVRTQTLSAEHRRKALDTGYSGVISGVLEYQNWTDKERAALVLEFPKYRNELRLNPEIRKRLFNMENKRWRRNHRLDWKKIW